MYFAMDFKLEWPWKNGRETLGPSQNVVAHELLKAKV